MSHDHDHHQTQEPHAHTASSGRRLAWVILLNAIITVTEYVAGLLSGSLALVSDAGHNLSDVLALILGYAGEKATEHEPTARYSFGLRRMEVLVALVNAISLLAIGAYVIVEAVERFLHPVDIDASILIPVAFVGLFGNLFSMLILRHGHSHSLNLRAAFLHLLFDTLSSVAVVGVGILLLFEPWPWLDLVVSLAIVVALVWSSVGIVTESLRILLQAAPTGIDPEKLREHLLTLPDVKEVHGLHVWSVNSTEIFLSCHLNAKPEARDNNRMIQAANAMLAAFGIHHTTIQVENDLCKHDADEACCR